MKYPTIVMTLLFCLDLVSVTAEPMVHRYFQGAHGESELPWSVGDDSPELRQAVRQFSQRLSFVDSHRLLDGLTVANVEYLFRSNGFPNVRDEGYEERYESWKRMAQERLGVSIEEWERRAPSIYREIVDSVDAEHRSDLEAALDGRLEQYRSAMRREFERLYQQADRLFVATRLSDPGALRRRAELETGALVDVAVRDRFQAQIEAIGEEAPEIAVAYNEPQMPAGGIEELSDGLRQWQEAERRVSEDRIAWESRTRDLFVQGETRWRESMDELIETTNRWNESIRIQRDAGLRRWREAEAEFVAVHDSMRREAGAEADVAQERLHSELETMSRFYLQAGSTRALAQRSISALDERIAELQTDALDLDASDLDALIEERDFWRQVVEESDAARRQVEQSRQAIVERIDGLLPEDRRSAHDRELAQLRHGLDLRRQQREVAEAVVQFAGQFSAGAVDVNEARRRRREAALAVDLQQERYEARRSELQAASSTLDRHGEILADRQERLARAQQAYDAARRRFEEGEIDRPELRQEEETVERKRLLYREALDLVEQGVDMWHRRQEWAQESYDAWIAARHTVQIAEEIEDYAAGGYALSDIDPGQILAIRQAEYDRFERIVNIVGGIESASSVSDGEYGGIKQRQQALRESLNWLGYLRTELEWRIDDDREAVEAQESLLGEAIDQLFAFEEDEEHEQFSEESMRWAIQMSQQPMELIDRFIHHYYGINEGVPDGEGGLNARILLEDDANLQSLRNMDRVRHHIGSLRHYMYSRLSRDGRELTFDPEQMELYRTFSSLFEEGRLRIDGGYVDRVISNIARNRVKNRLGGVVEADKNTNCFVICPWREEAKAIDRKRKNMRLYDLDDERGEIFASMTGIARQISERERLQEEQRQFVASMLSIEGFLRRFDDMSHTPSQQVVEAIRIAWNGQSSPEGDATVERLVELFGERINGIETGIAERLGEVDLLVTQRAGEIITAWQGNHVAYSRLLGQEEPSERALQRAAGRLFGLGAADVEGLLGDELHFANQIVPFDDEGWLLKSRFIEAAMMELLAARQSMAQNSADRRLQKQVDLLASRQELWSLKMNELGNVGNREWQSLAQQMQQERNRWRDLFEEDYLSKRQLWENRESLLYATRDAWIESAQRVVLERSTEELARSVGLDPRLLVADTDLLIPDVDSRMPSFERAIERTITSETMTSLVDRAHRLAARIDDLEVVSTSFGSRLRVDTALLRRQEEFSRTVVDRTDRRIALLVALGMRDKIVEATERIKGQVEEANTTVGRRFATMLEGGGYRRNGDLFRRSIIIDNSLLGGLEYETNRIGAYRYFVAPELRLGVDMSVVSLRESSALELRSMIETSSDRLQEHSETIFEDDGIFAEHVGESPVMRTDDPERVDIPGLGEAGRIVERYLRNEARQQRGFVMADMLWYEQRLWDDDRNNDGEGDSIIGAPNLRSVTGLVTSAVFGPVGGLVHGAVMGVLDIANGRDLGQTLLGFGKQALMAGVGFGVGEIFSVVDMASMSGVDLIAADVSVTTGKIMTTNIAGGIVNGVQIDSSGMLGFDGDALRSGLIGTGAIASLIGGVAGAGIDSALTGGTLGFSSADFAHLKEFTGVARSAVGTAINSVMNGSLTLNILNSDDLAGLFSVEGRSTGLLELRLDGDGASLAIGSDGFNVGINRISRAVSGAGIWRENLQIMDAARNRVEFLGDYVGSRDASVALRTQYSSREWDDRIASQYERLLSGEDRLQIGDIESSGGALGLTLQQAGTRIVQLATLGERGDAASQLRSGIVLGHESYRDGLVGNSEEQMMETVGATIAHTQLAERLALDYGAEVLDSTLRRDLSVLDAARRIVGGIKRFAAYVDGSYNADDDYWLLTEEGEIAWDGSRDLTDWNGNRIVTDETGSMSQSLARYVGMERAEELLGRDLGDWRSYNEQTLLDVTGGGRHFHAAMERIGRDRIDALELEQRQKLAGEALMKRAGMRWGDSWEHGEGVAFSLTDREIAGQIYLSDRLIDGEYEKFVASVEVFRNRQSYLSQRGDFAYQGRDYLVAAKRDLEGGIIDAHRVDGLQTVDIYDSEDSLGIDRDQPWQHETYGDIQGNTLAPGELWLQFGAQSHYAGDALLVNRAHTVGGNWIDEYGLNDIIGGGRWLVHANRLREMERDYLNKSSDGCLIPSTVAHLEFMAALEEWGVKPGYNIIGELREFGAF